MRPSWFISVGCKSSAECPYKRQEGKTQAQRRKPCEAEARLELCGHRPGNARSSQKPEEARKGSPLQPSGAVQLASTLILDFWRPENQGREISIVFKPLALSQFATVSPQETNTLGYFFQYSRFLSNWYAVQTLCWQWSREAAAGSTLMYRQSTDAKYVAEPEFKPRSVRLQIHFITVLPHHLAQISITDRRRLV